MIAASAVVMWLSMQTVTMLGYFLKKKISNIYNYLTIHIVYYLKAGCDKRWRKKRKPKEKKARNSNTWTPFTYPKIHIFLIENTRAKSSFAKKISGLRNTQGTQNLFCPVIYRS